MLIPIRPYGCDAGLHERTAANRGLQRCRVQLLIISESAFTLICLLKLLKGKQDGLESATLPSQSSIPPSPSRPNIADTTL